MFSIRNVSRFGFYPLIVIWLVVILASTLGVAFLLGAMGVVGERPVTTVLIVAVAILWLVGTGVVTRLAFRCPQCDATTLAAYGRLGNGMPYSVSFPPFWTPRTCSKCGLDFTNRTFWAGDNKDLRDLWVAMGRDNPTARR
jgi:hypothetical protein